MKMRFLVAFLVVSAALAGCLSTDETPDDTGAAPAPAPVTARVGGSTSEDSVESYPPGDYNLTGPYSRLLTKGPHDILGPERVVITSDVDGADIEMAVWLPDVPAGTQVPVLVFSSPYFYAEGALGGSRVITAPGGAAQVLIDEFVPHGYAFATHAVRGTAGSGGACNDLMGPKEIADADQAVTWLGEQEWSNGNVAMTGVSYDGSTPWSVASTGNPHLKTIIPISGVPDIYGLMYRNGSSETRGPVVLNALYYEIGVASGAPGPDTLARALCPEAWEGIALSAVAGVHGSDVTGYWQERNRKPGVEANYQGSVFSIQGLQDWNVDPSQVIPWVDELDRQGIKTKQLLGQWGHAWPDGIGEDGERTPLYRADYKEVLLRWLDSELKGLDVDTGPPVQVMDNLGNWRNEATFPPRDADWKPYYLSTDGQLVTDAGSGGQVTLLPNANPGIQEQVATPEFEGSPEFYVDYELGVVDGDLLVSGLPKVHATVVPHGPGGYMAAYLYARDAGGGDQRIGWTTMNLAYADGSHERQEVVPGMPLEVKMEVQPMDAVIKDGQRLVLRLWVFTDGDRLPTLPPNGVDLLIGDDQTALKLPVIERDESVYFMPPIPPEDAEDEDDEEGDGAAAA